MAHSASSLRRFLRVALVVLALGSIGSLAACGDDLSGRVGCTTADDCGQPLGMLTVECCGGYCMAASVGCTSGYRYITSEPEVGECVAMETCPITADMTVAEDMSKPSGDAGN